MPKLTKYKTNQGWQGWVVVIHTYGNLVDLGTLPNWLFCLWQKREPNNSEHFVNHFLQELPQLASPSNAYIKKLLVSQ